MLKEKFRGFVKLLDIKVGLKKKKEKKEWFVVFVSIKIKIIGFN